MADNEGVKVQPVPYKVALLDRTGLVSPTWARFFRSLFDRIGGVIALSNLDLEDLQIVNLTQVQTDISGIQANLSSMQTQDILLSNRILQLTDDFNQGPYL